MRRILSFVVDYVINTPAYTQTLSTSLVRLNSPAIQSELRIMAYSPALFSHNIRFTTNYHSNLNPNSNLYKLNTRRAQTVFALGTETIDNTTVAVIGGCTVAAIAAAISLPELEAEEVGGGDKEVVRDYFTNDGFQRWKKIYGDTDDVNKVQLDIRIGHAKTVESVMKMLTDEGSLKGVSVGDTGCGTGMLSIPLAKEGVTVSASDISSSMVSEAQKNVSL